MLQDLSNKKKQYSFHKYVTDQLNSVCLIEAGSLNNTTGLSICSINILILRYNLIENFPSKEGSSSLSFE